MKYFEQVERQALRKYSRQISQELALYPSCRHQAVSHHNGLSAFFWCSQKSGTLQTALYSKEWSCLFLFVCAKELREAKPLLFLDTSEERAWDFHCWQVRCACLQKSWEVFILSRRERVWIIYLSCIMKHIRVFFKQPVNLKCMRQSWWWR